MRKIKLLTMLAFVVLILPAAFILSACGNDESLKTFENITFIDQTIDYDGQEHEIVIAGELPQGTNVAYVNSFS